MKRLLLVALSATVCVSSLPAVGNLAELWKTQGVIYLNHSLNARMHPVPMSAVKMTEGFWAPRRKIIFERTLPALLDAIEERGFVDNFRRLSGKKNVARRGRPAADADVYQWIEAASWGLASVDTAATGKQQLEARMDALISDVLAAQDSTGYLNTYFSADRAHLRFTDLIHSQEDYCLGHLIQAGIAYYRVTGNRRLLDGAIRFADYVIATFGTAKRPFVSGHAGLEMALVELYRTTGETKYLDFARYLLSGVEKDRLHLKDSDIRYMFSGRPFTARTEFEGHTVRALDAASGATDFFAESGDPGYKRTLDLLWNDLTMRKMQITGGVAAQPNSDVFASAYELPAGNAAGEPCSAAAAALWSFRMLTLTGDARYGDVLERVLYNDVAAGISQNGTVNCFRSGVPTAAEKSRAATSELDSCSLNVDTLVESLPGYLYATSRDGLYVNLYNSSELEWRLEDGTPIKVVQTTDYPWNGEVKLTLYPARPSQFTVHLRWPSWAANSEVFINGNRASGDFERGSYVRVTRTWQSGDVITFNLPMQTVPMRANPRATDLYGKMAIQRGPIVYALDQADQGTSSLPDILIRANGSGTSEFHKEVQGGITFVKYPGFTTEKPLSEQPLYESLGSGFARSRRPITLTLVPYFSCSNRESTAKEVWIPMVSGPENATVGWNTREANHRLLSR